MRARAYKLRIIVTAELFIFVEENVTDVIHNSFHFRLSRLCRGPLLYEMPTAFIDCSRWQKYVYYLRSQCVTVIIEYMYFDIFWE